MDAHYVQIITEHYDLHMESLRDDGTSVVHHLFDSLFKAWASIVRNKTRVLGADRLHHHPP